MGMSATGRVDESRFDNPFDDLSDARALEAAANLVRTAAANLIVDDDCEDAAWLYVLSQELFKIVDRLECDASPSSKLPLRFN